MTMAFASNTFQILPAGKWPLNFVNQPPTSMTSQTLESNLPSQLYFFNCTKSFHPSRGIYLNQNLLSIWPSDRTSNPFKPSCVLFVFRFVVLLSQSTSTLITPQSACSTCTAPLKRLCHTSCTTANVMLITQLFCAPEICISARVHLLRRQYNPIVVFSTCFGRNASRTAPSYRPFTPSKSSIASGPLCYP